MRTRRMFAIAVVVLVIASAGCTGWGTDGPTDQSRSESNGTNGVDDLETTGDAGGESTASEDSDGSSEAGAGPDSIDSDDGSAEIEPSSSSGTDDTDSGTDSSDQGRDRTDDTGADAGSENDSDDGDTNDGGGTDASDGDETDANGDEDDDSDDGDENEPDDTDTDPETHTLTVHAGESIPVSDVPITLERHSDGATTTRETGESGQVEFTVVDGDYTVSGTDPDGTTDSADVTVDGEDTEVLLARLAPALPAEHDVRVTATDAETGKPIEGAVLEGVGNRHPRTGDMLLSVTTGADGVGESTAFESPYDSTIRADGYEERSETIVIDGETSLEYRLEPETTGPSADATNSTSGNATPA